MNQIELHHQIDLAINAGPNESVRALISTNQDAHNYFFSKATEVWLDWLWENGYLEGINKNADDVTRIAYRMPELRYLERMVEKMPSNVTDIILEVASSQDHFNPEVIDRFLWIASSLPSDQLERIAPKIRNENWVRLMVGFNHWGFEYEKILGKLAEVKDYKSLLLVAETVLSVRDNEDIKKTSSGYTTENPFYFNELSYTKVFEYLAAVDEEYAEAALQLATDIMSQIVLLGGRQEEYEDEQIIFTVPESYHLFDVDFFDLEVGQKEHLSYRDDVRELAAVIATLLRKLIKCGQEKQAHPIYKEYIKHLPDSRAMYRLRLFTIGLCPSIFKEEIKSFLFKLFKYEKPWDLISGAEYERLIQHGFSVLTEDERKDYIVNVINLFSQEEDLKFRGRDLLSAAYQHLSKAEKEEAEKTFGPLQSDYQPEPSIGPVYAGTVNPQAPGKEDEWQKNVSFIVEQLKTKWSPDKVLLMDKRQDFLKPVNAEGVGNRIKSEMATKTGDFITHAELFFDRDQIDPHYTYSFLRGTQDLLRDNKISSDIDISPVLDLLNEICASGMDQQFKSVSLKRDKRGWLANWTTVHNAMADIIKQLLHGETNQLIIDFKSNRETFYNLIKYLLYYDDPSPKDEQIETAKSKRQSSDSDEFLVSDPFTMAINSVRGQGFEALLSFVYHDGKLLKSSGKKIADDVKVLYEEVLIRENTQALYFMFGHYLPSFYYRDIPWIENLIPKIFSSELSKKILYIAAWEGYISNNLYQEIFENPLVQKLYERGIELREDDYPKRSYFRNIDEGLAVHLALAFVSYDEFSFESELFKKFWNHHNSKRHEQFISFIGRHVLANDREEKWIIDNGIKIEKLQLFWEWALKEISDPKALTGFGFWINPTKSIFDYKWLASMVRQTLEKTHGEVDWEYGLMHNLVMLAKESPTDTLAILKLFMSEGEKFNVSHRSSVYLETEILETFKILYNNLETQKATYDLINELLPQGNGQFWKLKEILPTV